MTDKGAADISTAVFLTSLLIFGAYLVVNFTVDDPFISFRYAKNLSQSNGLTYNPGERIEGFSNPAWVLLMTAPIPIAERIHPLAILWFAKFLGLILTIGACLLIASAEKKLFQRRFPTAAFLFAVNPCVWVWSVGALETPLCAFLLALAVYDSVPVNREKKRLWGPIAMGILSITRPEMPILLAVYIMYIYTRKYNTKLICPVLCSVFPFVAYLIFRILYYNDILPNTFYAKSASFDAKTGLFYLINSLIIFNHYFIALPFFIAGFACRGMRSAPLICGMTGIYLLFIILAGGDWMPAARFLCNISPLLCIVTAHGFHNVMSKIRGIPGYAAIAILICLLIAGNVYTVRKIQEKYPFSHWPWKSLSIESPVFPHYLEMGMWMRENLRRDDYVALGEAGLIPYVGDVRIIDCFGLMDKFIANLPGMMHYKFDAEYLLRREPDYILLIG